MRCVHAISATLILFFSGFCFAQNWVQYTSTIDHFRILAPGEFTVDDFDYASEYGAVFPARFYGYEDGASHYSVTVVDYTDAQRIRLERTNSTDADSGSRYWEIEVRASVAYAAWNLRQRGGEITFDAYHYINLIEGHQLQMTNSDQSRTFAAIYLHDSRLYIVEATVPTGSIPPGLFQQSLEILDEDGNRIRYRNLVDAIKVRNAPGRANPEP